MEGWLILILVVVGFCIVGWVVGLHRKAELYEVNKPRIDNLDRDRRAFEQTKQQTLVAFSQARQRMEEERQRHTEEVQRDKEALDRLAAEKSLGFPWLATAYADYFALLDQKRAQALSSKKRPARKAAEEVREIKKQKREAEKNWRTLRYRLLFYEKMFPWLVEFVGEDVDDYLRVVCEATRPVDGTEDEPDPARYYLSPGEYESLSQTEKYQRALDRYRTRKKSPWQIGRDFERYVGHKYESAGYDVDYFGIIQGMEDLGRDIIAKKDGVTYIVQCKYWAKTKQIHEKHLFQLFGTVIEYVIRGAQRGSSQGQLFDGLEAIGKIKPYFITSTTLSDTAKDVARILKIKTTENVKLGVYPIIKCNVARRDGQRIYHLPFDQQYDRIKIEPHRGERYVETVAEAESLGFRRAWRWRPEKGD